MPVTTAATNNAAANNSSNSKSAAPVAVTPFVRASMEHRELNSDISRALTTSQQDLGAIDINAYGYLRNIVLLVQATGGSGTGVAGAEDAPFNVLQSIQIAEPNGSVIANFNTGYDLYLANKYGGYRNTVGTDPRSYPVFSPIAAASGNFTFMLRIPIEIIPRDALGALPNQNSAASFKLKLQLAPSTTVYSTVPTTLPTVRVRAYLEAWDQPEPVVGGVANATTPPAVNTTQFWSFQTFNVSAGMQTVRLTRVGNYIRNLIFVYRAATRALGETNFPDPMTLTLDTRPIDVIERNNGRLQMAERTGYGVALGGTVPALDSAQGLDSGVFVYDFTHEADGQLGYEYGDLWLPTLGSTRLEVSGNFGAAGVLSVLTNDVAVASSIWR